MLLEICANSFQSAYNAQKAGAHRIELCVDLDVGGLTPSYGLIKKVIQDLTIPTFVLIRPRNGDFNYNMDEFEMMRSDIQIAKDLGCSGIVSGILNTDYSIDIERTKELVELSNPLPFTFHRAFDLLNEPIEAIEQLIDLGVERVLTSGQEYYAKAGIPLLQELKDSANGKIIILPGGGIDASNAILFKNAGFQEIHSAALIKKEEMNTQNDQSNNEKLFEDDRIRYSDVGKIKSILKVINNEK